MIWKSGLWNSMRSFHNTSGSLLLGCWLQAIEGRLLWSPLSIMLKDWQRELLETLRHDRVYNKSLTSEVHSSCVSERVPFLVSHHCFLSVYVDLSFCRSHWVDQGPSFLLQTSHIFGFKNQSGGICLGLCCHVLWIRLRTTRCRYSKRSILVLVKATIGFVCCVICQTSAGMYFLGMSICQDAERNHLDNTGK